MIAFRTLSGGAVARPLLDVYLDEARTIAQIALLDTGAGGIRLSAAIARAAGIVLPDEPDKKDVIAGGVRSHVFSVEHRLHVEVGGEVVSWTVDVAFCDPWPHPFGLLGLAGFFDAFDVRIQGRDGRFELTRRWGEVAPTTVPSELPE